jgi:hypothetical protein
VREAIASGGPQVIGVDLDTAEVDHRPKTDSDQQAVWPSDIPIVWARDVIFNEEGKPEKLFPVLKEQTPLRLQELRQYPKTRTAASAATSARSYKASFLLFTGRL